MAKSLSTDFDEEFSDEQPVAQVAAEPTVDKDEDGVPYCVKHHCRMKQTSGGRKGSSVAYFACPVNGCEEKAKRIKLVRSVIPSEPHVCQRCKNAGHSSYMERDPKLSNMMYTILRCPTCGNKSAPMPRPEMVANHERSRNMASMTSVDDLGTR